MSDLLLLLSRAQQGDNAAMMELIGLYMPMILKSSRINGSLNEDCMQHILLRTVAAIRKFEKIS